MNIDPTQNRGPIHSADVRETGKSAASRPSGPAEAPRESARYQASRASDTSQDIDTARVAEIREAISQGRLEIDTDRIADGIIASARALIDE
ncbi:flagellar biosynthesis anti-sigma factor FlgM [Salinisphaera sp. T31B1]|uniref:flagellar biosynthesis anti-sigma factor FlgM n=1 Tax=Salinisphaera sp. T31B1 TaxID=727963 RepID=UPI00333EFFF9